MTLSRRGFLGGIDGLLSLLVWPWKKEKPFKGYRVHYGETIRVDNAEDMRRVQGVPIQATSPIATIENPLLDDVMWWPVYGPDSDIVNILNAPNARPHTPLPVATWRVL